MYKVSWNDLNTPTDSFNPFYYRGGVKYYCSEIIAVTALSKPITVILAAGALLSLGIWGTWNIISI